MTFEHLNTIFHHVRGKLKQPFTFWYCVDNFYPWKDIVGKKVPKFLGRFTVIHYLQTRYRGAERKRKGKKKKGSDQLPRLSPFPTVWAASAATICGCMGGWVSKLTVNCFGKDEREGGGEGVSPNQSPLLGHNVQPLKPAWLEHCLVKSSLLTMFIHWLGCQSKHSSKKVRSGQPGQFGFILVPMGLA
jgi:hypothetical protein